ncbi:aldose 1-epimerase [Polaribacter aquimarinus]|uniref:Aldose epimerase n=1 Tax=Polaribacter aquimarinus TaxID=2100726 RepID=A0A2U2JC99_9FLAO|nr:aldose 1-epimerase [Polaribacter aquimarinus]PWG05901.1 aldose epimerase [Polaribacter aquimarinus]
MSSKVSIKNLNSIVIIDKGELISFRVYDTEYIHQKGNKGWRKSDDEMFPIIGPVSKNNYVVHTKNGDAIQDQHGLLRELEYVLNYSNETSARFIKRYKKNTLVKNSKYPEKSSEEFLNWPFNFTFEKTFTLKNNVLTIEFIINSEKGMPFMLGYHPAFLLSNSGKETFISKGTEHNLEDVYKAGSNAFPILNSNAILLKNSDKKDVKISTIGFNNFMLWTEVDNMVCIEPITQYTSYTNQKFSEENMSLSKGKNMFSVAIKLM